MINFGLILICCISVSLFVLMACYIAGANTSDNLPPKQTRQSINSMSMEELYDHIKTLNDQRKRDDRYARDYVSPDGVVGGGDPMYGRWLVEKEYTIKRIAILSRKGYPLK